MTGNGKTDSNKKCTELEGIGKLTFKILSGLKLEIEELLNCSFKISFS